MYRRCCSNNCRAAMTVRINLRARAANRLSSCMKKLRTASCCTVCHAPRHVGQQGNYKGERNNASRTYIKLQHHQVRLCLTHRTKLTLVQVSVAAALVSTSAVVLTCSHVCHALLAIRQDLRLSQHVAWPEQARLQRHSSHSSSAWGAFRATHSFFMRLATPDALDMLLLLVLMLVVAMALLLVVLVVTLEVSSWLSGHDAKHAAGAQARRDARVDAAGAASCVLPSGMWGHGSRRGQDVATASTDEA